MDISLPPMNENLVYQNPSNGIYEWSVIDVHEYIQEQISGGAPRPLPKPTKLSEKQKLIQSIKRKLRNG